MTKQQMITEMLDEYLTHYDGVSVCARDCGIIRGMRYNKINNVRKIYAMFKRDKINVKLYISKLHGI
jgi:hypothetical protein